MTSNSHITITRRRWDAYMLPFFIGLILVGIFNWTQTGRLWQSSCMPLVCLPLWVMLRRETPASGFQLRTIRGTPGTIPLLIWISCFLILGFGFIAFDSVVLGTSPRDPPKWYHWVAVITMFGLLFGGLTVMDRKWPKKPIVNSDANDK